MKRRLIASGVVGSLVLLGPMQAGAAEVTDEAGVPTLVRDAPTASLYNPQAWESPAPIMPVLDERAVVAVHDDDDQLTFLGHDELGAFLPAPLGGSVFFGAGQPMFGLASPPLQADRTLRPLGGGPAGQRFLGSRPTANPATVIPKLAQTFDGRRESFAFVDGVPELAEPVESGTTAFPLQSAVAAGGEWGVLDNITQVSLADPEDPAAPSVTPDGVPPVTSTETEPVPDSPAATPLRTAVPTTAPSPGTTIPRLAAPTAVATTTTVPGTPGTSVPPTTAAPTATPTTSAPTTTVPRSTTSTTAPTSTTTTTIPFVFSPPGEPSTSPSSPTTTVPQTPPAAGTTFVMGNSVGDDVTDANTTCLANGTATPGPAASSCDRLFDIQRARPGTPYRVNLTLWNVDPDSESDAVALKVFAAGGCVNGTVPGATPGSDPNLCGAVQLTIQRFTSASRTTPMGCIYGGTNCSFDPSKTLAGFAATHGAWSSGASIDGNFRVNDKAYLVVTVRLPDRGFDADGRGRDNEYMARTAAMALTWRMESS